ncbi:ABC transporter permease [Streptomyces sp. BI20]|uniref:ABC transporter permease n=1 Tax=Streptomyces sp. BI20 TaxID=3403460 RepID=UPI003C741209
MFRTALRNVLAHKARLAMTVFAVMLGVTFITGSLVYGDSQKQAGVDRVSAGFKNIDLNVDPKNEPGKPPASLKSADAATLAKLPGVTAAAGRVSGFTAVTDREGRLLGSKNFRQGGNFAPNAKGVDPAYAFVQGAGPADEKSIALDKDSAAKAGYRVGDTARVGTGGAAADYRISGLFTTDYSKLPPGGSLVLFGDAAGQALFSEPGHYNSIEIAVEPSTDVMALADQVEKTLPGTIAVTGAQMSRTAAMMASSDSDTMSQIMTGFAGIALFVATFLIANTFTMLVSRRTRELALMRAVGATRHQVRNILLAESALVGLVASVMGIAAGVGVAQLLQVLFATDESPVASLVIGPDVVFIAVVVGTVLPVLAAWLPIRRAMSIPPMAALSEAEPAAPATVGGLRSKIGTGSLVAGVAGVVIGLFIKNTQDSRTVLGLGAAVALTGVLLLIPLLSRPFVAAIRPLLLRFAPVHGDLATRNTVRDPRRTGATAAALAIALSLASGLSVLGASANAYIDRSTGGSFTADYLVESADGGPLSPETVAAVAKIPGATQTPLRMSTTYRLDGRESVITGVDPASVGKLMRHELVSGSMDVLAKGQIAVADFKMAKEGWKLGQKLPLVRHDKQGEVTIGAVYKANEEDPVMPSITASADLVSRYDEAPGIQKVLVSPKSGLGKAGHAEIVKALGDNPSLSVLDKRTIIEMESGDLAQGLNIFYALLSMALVIAALGIANTLAMSVMERRREIGMLRAIGLDRPGVARMIRLEALVVGVLGAVIGTVAGVFLGWAFGRTLQASVVGYDFVLPWGRLALGIGLAVGGALLASLLPARRAAQVDIPSATAAQ